MDESLPGKWSKQMDYLLGMIVGYIVHDALQPTAVGKVLDKVSLPADLLITPEEK